MEALDYEGWFTRGQVQGNYLWLPDPVATETYLEWIIKKKSEKAFCFPYNDSFAVDDLYLDETVQERRGPPDHSTGWTLLLDAGTS